VASRVVLHSAHLRAPTGRRPGRGFTLIEILVVVIIIGIIASMAVLSVNVLGRDTQAEDEARRLWAILRQTREEAELLGLNIGVYLATEEYEFLRFDVLNQRWNPIGDDRLYATRTLPEGLRYRLWLDGREVVMKPQLPERGGEEPEPGEEEKEQANLPSALRTIDRTEPPSSQSNPPQIVVLSSGDVMPFELHIEREREPALWRIVATPDNDLRVEQRPDTTEDWEIVLQTNPPPEQEARSNARK
jgi:general secretion pathway protein H